MAIQIAIGGALEVYSSGADWAKVRCTNGASSDWTQEVTTDGDGFLTLFGVVTSPHEQGFQIRWNANPAAYRLLLITNGGGDGLQYGNSSVSTGRTVTNGGIDWPNLETTHKLRVADLRWFDNGTGHGRFTRPSAAGITFDDDADRVVQVYEWIVANLNPLNRKVGLIGSSGGCDSVLSPITLGSSLMDNVQYLGLCSPPTPFLDAFNCCKLTTPAGTFVDEDTGELGASGIGIEDSGRAQIDYALANTKCTTATVTLGELAGFSDKDSFDAGGDPYLGTLHVLVGQAGDIDNGVIWAAGNTIHHVRFAASRRRWFSSVTDGHGDALSDVTSEGFAQVHAELVRLADGVLGGSMTLQFSTAIRNAMLDQIEAVLIAAGNDAILEIRTGAAPANCAAADSGTVLATIALPDDPFAAASSASKAKSGTWQDGSADNTGTAGHFRVKDHAGVCQIQGTVTATGGGGDLEVQNTSFAAGQQFTVTGFTISAGNP